MTNELDERVEGKEDEFLKWNWPLERAEKTENSLPLHFPHLSFISWEQTVLRRRRRESFILAFTV